MDVTPHLEPIPAPRVVFEHLEARRDRVRFMVPAPDGGWRPVTWGAFAADIRRIAAFLAAELSPGERATIYAPNSMAWGTAALAIQATGGVLVPIYPGAPARQAGYIARHAEAKVLFVDTAMLLARVFEAWDDFAHVRRIVILDDALEPRRLHADLASGDADLPPWDEIEAKVVPWSRALCRGGEADRREPAAFDRRLRAVDVDRPGLMLYTSGTTGDPKGVPLTHRNVGVNGADWLRCFAPLLEEEMVDLLWLPMSHIFGFGELCLGNTLGFVTYLSDPASVLGRLPEVRPSVFMSVPAYWEKLASVATGLDDPAERCERIAAATGGRLKVCLSGGAGLAREVKDLFYACGILLVEGYGLTETSPTLTLNRPDDFRFDAVGKPLPSVRLKLGDDGEILAKGPSVFSGYHRDPEATAAAFTEDGWFRTGDVGQFTDDGFLRIVDRKKDILVTAGGKNVPPANIEMRFQDDPFVDHVVVYGDGKRYLVAGVWPNAEAVAAWVAEHVPGDEPTEDAVHALLEERVGRVNDGLGRFETIKRFAVMTEPLTVEGGLLTPSLKVRRRQVHARYRDVFEALYAEPETTGSVAFPTGGPGRRAESGDVGL